MFMKARGAASLASLLLLTSCSDAGTLPSSWACSDTTGSIAIWWTAKGSALSGEARLGQVYSTESDAYPLSGNISGDSIDMTLGGIGALGGGLRLTGAITQSEMTLHATVNDETRMWKCRPAAPPLG